MTLAPEVTSKGYVGVPELPICKKLVIATFPDVKIENLLFVPKTAPVPYAIVNA